MKTLLGSAAIAAVVVVGLIVFSASTYTVSENENVILTQFGRPLGQTVTTPGLHFKLPLVQTVNRVDVRIQEWDGQAVAMPTRDKLYIIVDSFGRWRINDPLLWFTRLRDERSTLSRMEDIIGSENRNAVAKNDLIEIVRTFSYEGNPPAPKVLVVSPPTVEALGPTAAFPLLSPRSAEGGDLATAYALVAKSTGALFFDTAPIASANGGGDGVHLDAANTRAIGEALAPVVASLLGLSEARAA